ncbi:TauD/TfdA family dioxygenase [Planktothrix agardhii]|uniref:TauD/TfdA family dioxygenase n=1 Tax=Planktothrix agardhii TaxID=1160 RepID=UPI0020B41984|nr:TauD/TfdA family dioxygenase [Planktothrix agardhii]
MILRSEAKHNLLLISGQKQQIHPKEGKQSNDAFKFHTDRCDANSLLCIRQARTGGENHLASAITIYNEMCQSHPDIAEELFQEIPCFFEGENNWTTYPLWCIHKGKFTTSIPVLMFR